MTVKKTQPRGRPPKPEAEKKRRNFTFRSTDAMHDALAEAAAEKGRSISEEIEWRLGQSFHTDLVVQLAINTTLKQAFAYIDDMRAKVEAERAKPPMKFGDLTKGIFGDGNNTLASLGKKRETDQ